MDKLMLSRRQAAESLGISIRSLDYLIQRTELRARRIGRRILIPRTEVERFARGDHPNPIMPSH